MSSEPEGKRSKISYGKFHHEQTVSNPSYYNRGEDRYQNQSRGEYEENEGNYPRIENQYSNSSAVTMPYVSSAYSYSTGSTPKHQENFVAGITDADQSSTSYPSGSVQNDYYRGLYSSSTIPSEPVTDLKWQQPNGSTRSNMTSFNYASQTPRSTSQRTSRNTKSRESQQEINKSSFASTSEEADFKPFQIKDALPDANEGTLFGRICDDIGILKGLEESKSHKARGLVWSPERLQSSCFFVCIRELLNKTWENLSGKLDLLGPSQLQGVKLGEIEQIIQRVGGLRIVVFPALEDYGSPAYQREVALRLLSEQWIHLFKNRPFIIGYRRSNVIGPLAGHCVIAKHIRGEGNRLSHYKFLCYQNDDRGKDMSDDIRMSYIKFAIFRDERTNMDFYHETPDWCIFEHVQLFDEVSYSKPTRASSPANEERATSTPKPSYTYPISPAGPATTSSASNKYTYRYDPNDDRRYC